MIKIHTTMAGGLCVSCRSSQMIEQCNRVTVTCHAWSPTTPRYITEPVQRCNEYEDRNTPTKWEMEQIAWTLRTEKDGRRMGFTPPKRTDRNDHDDT